MVVAYNGLEVLREDGFDWMPILHSLLGKLVSYLLRMEHVLDDTDVLILHSGWVYHNVAASRPAIRAGFPMSSRPAVPTIRM